MSPPREVTMLPPVDLDSDTPSRRRLPLRSIGAILAAAALVVGCSSSPNAVGGGGHGPGGTVNGDAGSCLRDEPGCACKHEGMVIQCGMEVVGGCNMGGQICSGGQWSECETNSNDPALQTSEGLKLVSGLQLKGVGTSPAPVGCTNKCDPYCMRYPGLPGNPVGPDGGASVLGCGDASILTVVTGGNPEASVPPAAVIADAGLADGEGVLYLVLAPNQTAVREFTTPAATIKNADIYFLVQDTSSMGPAASNLAVALTNTTSGIITGIKSALSGVGPNFGVGRFEDYYYAPYVGAESDLTPPVTSGCGFSNSPGQGGSYTNICTNEYDLPFQHLLSMQSDSSGPVTAEAVQWLITDAFAAPCSSSGCAINAPYPYIARGGGDIPEASVSALWMIATGNGLAANYVENPSGSGIITNAAGPKDDTFNTPPWWQVPRQWWTGTPIGVASMGTTAVPNTGPFPGIPLADQYPAAPFYAPCPVSSVSTTPSGMTWPCFRTGATPVVVILGDAPAHQGPGGQYPYVNEPYAPIAPGTPNLSPQLPGANSWPVTPAGGCPAGYGGTIGNGACQLIEDPNTTGTGLEFANPIRLPGLNGLPLDPVSNNDSTPLPGVYYGIVQNSVRAYQGNTGYQWYSASSVGNGSYDPATSANPSGVFNINTTASLAPGYPQRNSLRDCLGTGGADDAYECTPSMGGNTGVPPVCYEDTPQTSAPAQFTSTGTSTSTYLNAATAPTQTGVATIAAQTETLPAEFTGLASVNLSHATVGFQTSQGKQLPGNYTNPPITPNYGNNGSWTTFTPVAYAGTAGAPFTGWSTVVVHGGGTPCVTSDVNGTYATCNDGTPVASITLNPGEGISNITISIVGEGEGTTASLTGVIANAPGLATGTVVSSDNTAAASVPNAATFYAGASTITVSLSVQQNYTPNNSGADATVQFVISYQTNSVTGTCGTPAGLQYIAAGANETAICPTCSGTDSFGGSITYVSGNSCSSYTGCPGGDTQGSVASGTNEYCYAPCNATSGGFTATAWNDTNTGGGNTTCEYLSCNNGSYPNGPVGGYCYPACPASVDNLGNGGTFTTSLPAGDTEADGGTASTTGLPGCTYGCGGSYPNQSGSVCYAACSTIDAVGGANDVFETSPAIGCQGVCSRFDGTPSGTYAVYNLTNAVQAAGSSTWGGATCYSCASTGEYPKLTWDGNNATCTYCGPSSTTVTATTTSASAQTIPAGGGPLNVLSTANLPSGACSVYLFTGATTAINCTSCQASGTQLTGCTAAALPLAVAASTPVYNDKLLDVASGGAYECDACASDISPVTPAFSGAYTYECAPAGCTNGYTQSGSNCQFVNACQNAGAGTGAGVCPGTSGTSGVPGTYTTYTLVSAAAGSSTTIATSATLGGSQTITVASNSGFTGAAQTIYVETSLGLQAVSCTNTSGTTKFTTCTGGSGTAAVGNAVFAESNVAAAPGTCACEESKVVTTAATTYASCPIGGDTSTPIGAGTCVTYAGYTNYAGGTCGTCTGTSCPATTSTTGCTAGYENGYVCTPPTVPISASCSGGSVYGGDGYFGNDAIYSFTIPKGSGLGSRYYYHFALLREGPDGSGLITGAAPGGVYPAVPQANVAPMLYIKSANGFVMNSTLDSTYPYSIPQSASASDSITTNAGPDGPVIDCNVSAMRQLTGSSPSPATDYVVAEIDGYLPTSGSNPTTYYLVVDNAISTSASHAASYLAPPPKFQFWLQVGGFDDVPANATTPESFTQPSYNQAVTALKNLQAQVVGVENSGFACLRQTADPAYTPPSTNTAQYETLDFMQKLAYDVGSYDLGTNRPYVVSVTPNGNACNPSPPAATIAAGAGASATWCSNNYSSAPLFDTATNACTKGCTTNAQCPMNTPICETGASTTCTGTGPVSNESCCTTSCSGGVAGLSCAVAAAVGNLTGNLKQNVYLRPISTTAGSSYVAPGAACTPTALPSSASAQCAVAPATACYGGTCTSECNTTACTPGFVCEPSTIANDYYMGTTPNKYCISPSVFIQSVQAVSQNINPTGSAYVCGIHPGVTNCSINSQCVTANPALPTCLTTGPNAGTCGIADTGPDTVAPQPSYYNPADPPQDNDGMFNLCSPGSQVNFVVTFQMPFQRSSDAQQYEFDLGIYAGAGIIGRTRVIIENPALQAASFYSFYDGNAACAGQLGGSHVVWGNFTYNAVCPADNFGNYSDIRFCASSAATAEAGFVTDPGTDNASGCEPGEVLLGIATAAPLPDTTGLGYTNTCPAFGTPGMGASTTIAMPSNGKTMGTSGTWGGVVNVATTSGYPSSGEVDVASSTGVQTITYTGLTPTSFTGCLGGSGTMATGGAVTSANQGFNVGNVLAASGASADAGFAQFPYLRIRIELDPSTPGDTVAPILDNWNLNIDCIPSE